jgi:hypothetical protein
MKYFLTAILCIALSSIEIAKSLKDMGVLTATIIASTGLTKEEIEKL